MKRWGWAGFVLTLVLSGCAGIASQEPKSEAEMEPIIVRVSGFGTYENVTRDRLDTQKRLLARRASKLDAYRNLAERVYGTVIQGDSSVGDFVLRNDRYLAYVDSYIRGAKVVSVEEHSDGVIETVMRLKLEPRFRHCVAGTADENVQKFCPIPMPRSSDSVRSGDNDSTGSGQSESSSVDSLYYLE